MVIIVHLSSENTKQPIAERVEIYGTEDEKLRSLGEVLITDVSRNILKLLLENTFTANEISIKTGYSLQLVRYHLKKIQDAGLAEISKIGKNTKSHDMKYYSATKFAIVILPSKFSDKAKSSKSLIKSLKSLYRFGAIGIAAIGSWFATIAIQGTGQLTLPKGVNEVPNGGGYTSYNPFYNAVGGPYSGDGGIGSGASLGEMLKLARSKVAIATQNPHAGSGTPFFSNSPIPPDFFLPIIIALTVIAFGLSMEIILRMLKIKEEHQ